MTRDQVRRLDELAVELGGMSIEVLMENAGCGCAEALLGWNQTSLDPIVIVCGKGNNAGDGFVMARHLDLAGRNVTVAQCAPATKLSGAAATNFQVLAHTGVRVLPVWRDEADLEALSRTLGEAGCVVDALFGVGFNGQMRPPYDRIIEAMNAAPCSKFAIDIPSGLDCDSGFPANPTFRADLTCTFVAEKLGFQSPEAKPYLGEVRVLGIGAPRRIVEAVLAGEA
jgi:NAD(P)H-hydrate epimerase